VLEIQIAGLTPGLEHDAVHVTGNLTLLGGTLDVIFIDGFNAAMGDSFDLLDFASLSGAFGAVNLPGLMPGLLWDSSNLYSTGVLSVKVVPEPGTYVLMAVGLLLLVARRLRAG
jgi:PEP-CTERM motif